ncbi:unnamed protein product [Paramecium octaurelia]|uniref:Uncharacterized protein n=1 Tax=Paramecium octaurelia TaxID=43137 RepID=A0A8S1UXK7_PAROT|nr:unnamed protein product [Paramecium octaurelia]
MEYQGNLYQQERRQELEIIVEYNKFLKISESKDLNKKSKIYSIQESRNQQEFTYSDYLTRTLIQKWELSPELMCVFLIISIKLQERVNKQFTQIWFTLYTIFEEHTGNGHY